ncbi:hypothetical protein [Peptostreptococcus faecalis]|uniref:hypothetical protein n=1 Tax=Peptostreptococcus faecalis TaxID=2045015 RepID=UPI000C7E2D45|nr:hypothetical protein [Peptostreptococcus faecalis]
MLEFNGKYTESTVFLDILSTTYPDEDINKLASKVLKKRFSKNKQLKKDVADDLEMEIYKLEEQMELQKATLKKKKKMLEELEMLG